MSDPYLNMKALPKDQYVTLEEMVSQIFRGLCNSGEGPQNKGVKKTR